MLIYIVYALSASLDARIRYMTNRKCRKEERGRWECAAVTRQCCAGVSVEENGPQRGAFLVDRRVKGGSRFELVHVDSFSAICWNEIVGFLVAAVLFFLGQGYSRESGVQVEIGTCGLFKRRCHGSSWIIRV